MNKKKEVVVSPVEFLDAFLGATGLMAFYFLVLRLGGGSWDYAFTQFKNIWLWILVLDLGFGIQVGLASYLYRQSRILGSAGKITTANMGVSATSMVMCCAHHLADILPIIGISGALVILAEYQVWFIVIGIISNIFGIHYLVKQVTRLSAIALSEEGGEKK